jgi:hypothetical protein
MDIDVKFDGEEIIGLHAGLSEEAQPAEPHAKLD